MNGELEEAVAPYLRSVEISATAQANARLGKVTRACRCDNPCFPHFNLRRHLELKHHYRRALRADETALELNPRVFLARAAIRWLKAQFN